VIEQARQGVRRAGPAAIDRPRVRSWRSRILNLYELGQSDSLTPPSSRRPRDDFNEDGARALPAPRYPVDTHAFLDGWPRPAPRFTHPMNEDDLPTPDGAWAGCYATAAQCEIANRDQTYMPDRHESNFHRPPHDGGLLADSDRQAKPSRQTFKPASATNPPIRASTHGR